MSVFNHPDFDDHEHVSFFRDAASGLSAVVAIHSTAPLGMAGGGCRMWPYASDEAALRDALRLSRAMSYKLVLCGMPAGGAKCVVIGDSRKDKTEALLRALGRSVDRLGGRFVIAEDVGTTPQDMQIIATETRYVIGRETDTGAATAYGTFVALREGVRYRLGRGELAGLKVAVQGTGNVGRRLCQLLARAGSRLVVTDIDAAAARKVGAETGAAVVAPDAIYDQVVDVFAPCALGAILNDATIPRLQCQVIAGSANNQLDEERHGDVLAARGILLVPDFVANAGGVIGASQEGKRLSLGTEGPLYDEDLAFREADRIGEILKAVFDRAERARTTPNRAATMMAKEKIEQLRTS